MGDDEPESAGGPSGGDDKGENADVKEAAAEVATEPSDGGEGEADGER